MMKTKDIFLASIIVATCSTGAYSNTLTFKNSNNKPVDIKIVRNDEMTVSEQKESTIDLNNSKANKSTFSIEGSTSVFSPNGKCKDLDPNKNYHVTFTNDKMGTSCIAVESAD